jgi:uncharacterized protein
MSVRHGAVRFAVHVQPRASRDEVVGLHGDALKVRLRAPPVEGAANEALRSLLAEALGVGRAAVSVVAGTTARAKTVEVVGVSLEDVSRLATGHSGR